MNSSESNYYHAVAGANSYSIGWKIVTEKKIELCQAIKQINLLCKQLFLVSIFHTDTFTTISPTNATRARHQWSFFFSLFWNVVIYMNFFEVLFFLLLVITRDMSVRFELLLLMFDFFFVIFVCLRRSNAFKDLPANLSQLATCVETCY